MNDELKDIEDRMISVHRRYRDLTEVVRSNEALNASALVRARLNALRLELISHTNEWQDTLERANALNHGENTKNDIGARLQGSVGRRASRSLRDGR